MVKAVGFRWGGTTQPTDSTYKYDPKTGTYFPVSYTNEDGNITAEAGPFSFKTEMSTESKFTWTPLSAELNVGASFGLSIGTKLSTQPVGVGIEWKPALPAGTPLVAGTAAALTAVIAGITGLSGMMGASSGSGKTPMQISAYMTLVATALALVAIQKNMTMELNLPLRLDATLHPLLVVKKEEGESATFGALDAKTDVFKWESNTSNAWAALGVVRNNGAEDGLNGGDVGANAVQTRVSGVETQS